MNEAQKVVGTIAGDVGEMVACIQRGRDDRAEEDLVHTACEFLRFAVAEGSLHQRIEHPVEVFVRG